jgi:hypothetical protein
MSSEVIVEFGEVFTSLLVEDALRLRSRKAVLSFEVILLWKCTPSPKFGLLV